MLRRFLHQTSISVFNAYNLPQKPPPAITSIDQTCLHLRYPPLPQQPKPRPTILLYLVEHNYAILNAPATKPTSPSLQFRANWTWEFGYPAQLPADVCPVSLTTIPPYCTLVGRREQQKDKPNSDSRVQDCLNEKYTTTGLCREDC